MIKYKENRFIKAINPRNNAIVYVDKIRWDARNVKSKRYGAYNDRLAHLERVGKFTYEKTDDGFTSRDEDIANSNKAWDEDRWRFSRDRLDGVLFYLTICPYHFGYLGRPRLKPELGFRTVEGYNDCDKCRRFNSNTYISRYNKETQEFDFIITDTKEIYGA